MKNRIQILLLSLGFLMIGFAQAQSGQLSGQIIHEKGAPLPGASVLIAGTNNGAMTDFEGNFTLSGLENGAYQVIISYVGFGRKRISATGPQSQPLSVILTEDATQLDDVVVPSVFDAHSRMDASMAISTIGTKQLDRMAPTSSSDLLKNIPGVFVNQARGEIWNSVHPRALSTNSIDNINGNRYICIQEDGL